MTSLRCRVGQHVWEVRANDDGERYRECGRCGAIEDDGPPPTFWATAIGPPGA